MEIKELKGALHLSHNYIDEVMKRSVKIKTIRPSTPTQNYLNPTWVDETLKKGMKINLEKSK
jgi:hypothetical protein